MNNSLFNYMSIASAGRLDLAYLGLYRPAPWIEGSDGNYPPRELYVYDKKEVSWWWNGTGNRVSVFSTDKETRHRLCVDGEYVALQYREKQAESNYNADTFAHVEGRMLYTPSLGEMVFAFYAKTYTFDNDYYWTSSEADENSAYAIHMGDGSVIVANKQSMLKKVLFLNVRVKKAEPERTLWDEVVLHAPIEFGLRPQPHELERTLWEEVREEKRKIKEEKEMHQKANVVFTTGVHYADKGGRFITGIAVAPREQFGGSTAKFRQLFTAVAEPEELAWGKSGIFHLRKMREENPEKFSPQLSPVDGRIMTQHIRELSKSMDEYPAFCNYFALAGNLMQFKRIGVSYLPSLSEMVLILKCLPDLFKEDRLYWTSTEYDAGYAYAISSKNGSAVAMPKTEKLLTLQVFSYDDAGLSEEPTSSAAEAQQDAAAQPSAEAQSVTDSVAQANNPQEPAIEHETTNRARVTDWDVSSLYWDAPFDYKHQKYDEVTNKQSRIYCDNHEMFIRLCGEFAARNVRFLARTESLLIVIPLVEEGQGE